MPDPKLDLKLVTGHFQQAIIGDDISMEYYCKGYGELSNLLDSLGRLMYFVIKDVDQKLRSLNDLRDSSKHPPEFCENFSTLRKMCQFESKQYENNKPKPSTQLTLGCRNLLRLHRALLFIIDLFEKVFKESPEKTLTELAKSAYENSLAKHHPWAVRQAVGVAFHALPYRHTFVASIVANQPPDGDLKDETSCQTYLEGTMLPALKRVYGLTEEIFAMANFLELP